MTSSVEQMTNLELAAMYAALTEQAIARGLITGGYHQNANSLVRHMGRQVMGKAAAELKGAE